MSGFYDAVCKKCKRKIGWSGSYSDRPACRCGHRPPQEELLRADREEREMMRKIFGKDVEDDDAD